MSADSRGADPLEGGLRLLSGKSPGVSAAAARHETITVGFDFLRLWREEREERRRRTRSRAAMLAGTVALGGLALPPLIVNAAARQRELAAARVAEGIARGGAEAAAAAAAAAAPARERKEMRAASAARTDALLGDLATILQNAERLRFSVLTADVADGKIEMKVSASAATAGDVRRFVEAAGRGPSVERSSAASLRRTDAPFPGGIAFEYVRRSGGRR